MSSADDHQVLRSIVICARRDTVFRFFTDPSRFAAWWGAGSVIEPRVGGALRICYPGGQTASGTVKELTPGERVVFTYGYDDPGKPIAPGGSTVEITFADVPGGTRVTLRHSVGSPELAKMHEPGWRYQLALYAKVAAAAQHERAEDVLDAWFAAWGERDPGRRRALLETCTTAEVSFSDDFAHLGGREDLDGHIAAMHVHRPDLMLVRAGPALRTHASALVPWQGGTSFVDFAPDGRIARVVSFSATKR
jgi:uncharacterized protein YndB with AHSA1/START domain